MPKKFWIVWSKNYEGYIQRHPTYKAAAECAEMIANRKPQTKVYILEALDYRWIPPSPNPPMERHILELAEDSDNYQVNGHL